MKLKDEIAELRSRIPGLKKLAMPDVDDGQLTHLLDFTDAAIAALNACEAKATLGAKVCAENHPAIGLGFSMIACNAAAVLAKLEKEVG